MQHNTSADFWKYLSPQQKNLINQGDTIIKEVIEEGRHSFDDYAFIVFPYAKAFEGFLKQLFKDVGFLTQAEYVSDHLRLGKLMSPNLVDKLGDRSLYSKLVSVGSKDLADKIWDSWRNGRNRVFHYFPHNLEALSLSEAQNKIEMILETMEYAYDNLYTPKDINS